MTRILENIPFLGLKGSKSYIVTESSEKTINALKQARTLDISSFVAH
jgi:hypothetical protein